MASFALISQDKMIAWLIIASMYIIRPSRDERDVNVSEQLSLKMWGQHCSELSIYLSLFIIGTDCTCYWSQ